MVAVAGVGVEVSVETGTSEGESVVAGMEVSAITEPGGSPHPAKRQSIIHKRNVKIMVLDIL
jgi:hypothetical protein